MKCLLTTLLGFLSLFPLIGQNAEIEINNPSFEGIPHKGNFGSYISGWYDCGVVLFKNETPPDLHPLMERVPVKISTGRKIVPDTIEQGIWEVSTRPSDGNTYLGMVVRDNDTWESLSQRLRIQLEDGKCYSFSIDLSRSDYYVSGSRLTEQNENYTSPSVLRIWGGTSVCGKQELLGESVTVENRDWRSYEFEFRPERGITYFTIEAFYKVPTLFPYNGHLLLDNASVIKEIPCDEDELIAPETEEIVVQQNQPQKPRTPAKTAPAPVTESLDVAEVQEETIVAEESPKPKNVIPELRGKNFKKGQVIRISNIYFEADSRILNDNSVEAIEQIYDFMLNNKGLVIEVGGHTATVPKAWYCDELSTDRAKTVATYLARMGISTKRLYYKGYGKRKPIIPNDKFDMTSRRKNQRVEIKILKTDYKEA